MVLPAKYYEIAENLCNDLGREVGSCDRRAGGRGVARSATSKHDNDVGGVVVVGGECESDEPRLIRTPSDS